MDSIQRKLLLAVTDGGTFAADTKFESGKLATPIKEGSIFDGWYKNEGCTGTAVTTSTAGETYYAKWIELKSDAISMEYGSTQTLPTIEGVTLSNWQSSDSTIVSIEDDQLKANKVGKTTITATARTEAGSHRDADRQCGSHPHADHLRQGRHNAE